ncbi:MAG: hypothetical protein IPJ19_16485 [Planctomycetes bacterium]|nr:hypothetical protein [Planctomycetota bacterium]
MAWVELVRDGERAHYVPHLADDDSGVGTRVVTGDVDHDHRRDIVIGNKRGVSVLLQRDASVVAAKKKALDEAGRKRGGALGPAPRRRDFETGDLRGWTKTGTAFDGQPIGATRSRPAAARRACTRASSGSAATRSRRRRDGHASPNPITVEQPWASSSSAAAQGTAPASSCMPPTALLFKTSAANYESMQRVVVDPHAQLGKKIGHLIDEEAGGWGHLNFDDFRFHTEKPSFEQPAGVPRIRLPLDAVANAGLAPGNAAKAMTVPPGFHVDLIASEPDVHQPIAFASTTADACGSRRA